MATYRKRGMRWRAEVRRKGVTESASFDTKAAAVAWATRVEAAIDAGKYGQSSEATFGDLLRRYADEVSPSKEGARWSNPASRGYIFTTRDTRRLRV